MSGTPRPVIFDFDGVLADNESLWDAEIDALLVRRGSRPLSAAEHTRLRGVDDVASWALVAAWTGTAIGSEDVPAINAEIDATVRAHWLHTPRPVPGARELVERLAAAAHPLAIASTGQRARISETLEAIGIARHFRTIVTIEDVVHPKPAPEAYLAAARRLGVAPAAAIAIEDSVPGATAAREAGLTVIGLDRRGDGGPGAVAHRVVRALEALHDLHWARHPADDEARRRP